ncbi:hypothetical protein K438DRAFT_1754238 [Mycena galopus ATCC 62051]|nr:hypothetical protein K438DRAFT_1754238 [Mycena galopus ATCC 62051]
MKLLRSTTESDARDSDLQNRDSGYRMKFFTFVSAALATLVVANAMSVNIQAAGNGITPLQLLGAKMSKLSNEVGYGAKEPLLNNIEETLAALLGYPSLKPVGSFLANMHTMNRRADAADSGITLLQSLIDQMSKLNNEIQAMASDNGAKEVRFPLTPFQNGLGRRGGDLLTNLLEPLLGNLEDTIAKLLGYPSLTPASHILANMHTIVKALPSLAGGGSLGLGGN